MDKTNCLIVCDRGAMDASACEFLPYLLCTCVYFIDTVCAEKDWQKILKTNDLDSVILRDQRYDQIVHLVTMVTLECNHSLYSQETAAKGAVEFYHLTNNSTREEGLELARDRDTKAAQVSISTTESGRGPTLVRMFGWTSSHN